jgi:hypothetical protein
MIEIDTRSKNGFFLTAALQTEPNTKTARINTKREQASGS